MLGEVGQADHLLLPDHQTQDPVAPGRGPDPVPLLLRDPERREALQQAAIRVQHADRRVLGTDERRRYFDNPLQHAFQRQFRGQQGASGHQLFEPMARGHGS